MKAEIVYRRVAECSGRHAGRSRPRAPGTASHRAIPGSRAVRRAGGTSPIPRAPYLQRHGARGRSLLGGDSYRGGQSVEWSFDSVSHDWLVRFVEHRIGDPRVIRLIRKWLKAGVMEDGRWAPTETGTPQGSVISPMLANVYLHYCFDLWAERWRHRTARGNVIYVRYADDLVAGFEYADDARSFLAELRERLDRFELTLHPEKTRLIEFGRYAAVNRARRGSGKPETFDFLGFKHISGRSRAGYFQLRRKSRRDRMLTTLRTLKVELLRRRHEPIPVQGRWLGQVVRGYFAYHAVPTNFASVRIFLRSVMRLWLRALRRRGQRHGMTWKRIARLAAAFLPPARILHPWPDARFRVNHPRWKPSA